MFRFICPRFIFMVEKWKWNKEFRLYVSNTGHFRDEHKQPKPIKMGSNGYIYVKTRNGYQTAHRLVMKTWKPTEDMENLTVDHLDHNKRNNAVDNLEWVTQAVNRDRAKKDFLIIKQDSPTEKQPKVKEPEVDRSHMKRYNRTDYTPDDIECYIMNNKEFTTIADAYAHAIEVIKEREAKTGGPSINMNDASYEAIAKRYTTLLNRAKTKEVNIIDGKKGIKAFRYLNMKIRIKKQEDEK